MDLRLDEKVLLLLKKNTTFSTGIKYFKKNKIKIAEGKKENSGRSVTTLLLVVAATSL
jgi:hypothetical protein